MNIEMIRTPDQAARVANAFEERFHSLIDDDPWFKINDFVDYYHQNWEHSGVPRRVTVYARDEDGKIIGFGVAQEDLSSGEGLWNIPIFGVIAEHVKQGFGTRIFRKLIEESHNRGANSFLLNTNLVDDKVSGGKSPRPFWEKMGFSFIGSHDGYLSGKLDKDGVGGWFILDTNSLVKLLDQK